MLQDYAARTERTESAGRAKSAKSAEFGRVAHAPQVHLPEVQGSPRPGGGIVLCASIFHMLARYACHF